MVKEETATPVSSRPEKSERAVAAVGLSVDNDRMLSLTGGGRKEGREKGERRRAQKVTVLFTLSGEGEGIIGVKDRVAKRAENGQTNEGRKKESFLPGKIN